MFALAVMAINDKDYDTAEQYLKPLLEGDRSQDAAFQLGRMYEMQDDYATALQHYGSVDKGGQAIEAVMPKSTMLSKLDHLDDARKPLQSQRDNFPPFAPDRHGT